MSAPAERSPFFEAMRAGPTRAVFLVCLIGGLSEFVPAFSPLSFFSPRKSSKVESPAPSELPARLNVGEVELTVESRSQEAMAIPKQVEALRGGTTPIGSQESALDLPSIEAEASPVELLNPKGTALDQF